MTVDGKWFLPDYRWFMEDYTQPWSNEFDIDGAAEELCDRLDGASPDTMDETDFIELIEKYDLVWGKRKTR